MVGQKCESVVQLHCGSALEATDSTGHRWTVATQWPTHAAPTKLVKIKERDEGKKQKHEARS